MLDFLASISDAIVTLFSFLISQVQNLFYLLQMLGTASGYLITAVGFLPPVISVFAVCAITVSIVYLIIGR